MLLLAWSCNCFCLHGRCLIKCFIFFVWGVASILLTWKVKMLKWVRLCLTRWLLDLCLIHFLAWKVCSCHANIGHLQCRILMIVIIWLQKRVKIFITSIISVRRFLDVIESNGYPLLLGNMCFLYRTNFGDNLLKQKLDSYYKIWLFHSLKC